jgi:hypothetical protein
MAFTEEVLRNRFQYHKPTGNKPVLHEEMRNACFDLAVLINKKCPDCREQAVAITKLEEVMMWANTAITRYPETILEEDKK